MGKEFEMKYRADEASRQALQRAYPGGWQQIQMETTYYDTPEGALSQRRITLRKRMENGVPICTVKTPGQGMSRGEWEVEAEDICLAIPMLCKLGCPESLLSLTRDGVMPVCGARFTRLARTTQFMQSSVEIALDCGVLFAGDREVPLNEMEVELKEGQESDVMTFCCQLQRICDLIPEPESKFRRAMSLREER